jgi:hypothetical protein
MKATIKASNILIGSGHVFTTYQVAMADQIFNLIQNRDYKELGKLVNTVKTKMDYEYIHYAFYDKHEFGWLAHVEKKCSYEECIRYGFYNYDFS